MFKFEAWWIMEESIEEEIKTLWESKVGILNEKLERLQIHLKSWVGKIKKRVKRKLTKDLEILIVKERDGDTMTKIIDTKIHLNMEIDKEEMYWEQRARANWLKLGDKNSTFFQKYASNRKRINTISMLELDEGGEVTEEIKIHEAATSFLLKLFTSIGVRDPSYLLTGIENNISQDINTFLLSTFIADEYTTLKGMGPIKTPVPDGFPTLFFQKFWHIVGKDVTTFFLEILIEDKCFGFFNSTDIVLIPKTSNPTNLVNYRPISL